MKIRSLTWGESITTKTNARKVATAFGLDVLSVVLFVAVGRRNHNLGNTVAGVVEVALPFLIALIVAWTTGQAWRKPFVLSTGVIVWLITVVLGLLLRNLVFDRGIALAFVIVATLTLGFLHVGWRAIFRLVRLRRS